MEQFEMVAKTFQGLEDVLAEELTALGADNIQIGRRMVSFTGDKEMLYRSNFALRTAVRILKPIIKFEAHDPDEVYEQIKSLKWEKYLDESKTFAIDAVVYSEEFRHSKFVSYRVKDAIADYFREKTGKRPSVSVTNPDVQLNIHISETHCTLSLDSSGKSLHQRGYRVATVEAPLNEVLAAGMILMTGWRGECDLIDPMCGSGTIPIEAALIARNIAPGIFRQGYAFEKWDDFDADLLDRIYNDDSQEREFTHHIYAYDNSPKAIAIARENIKSASLAKNISLELRPIQEFVQPVEKSMIITNPPYGERIGSEDLLGLYAAIGERLKNQFKGNTAWILSLHEECFAHIGLKPSKKVALNNGALECQFRQYEMFSGSFKEFLESGGKLDKDFEVEAKEDRKPHHHDRRSFDRERKPFNYEQRTFDHDRKPFNRDRKPFDHDRKPLDRDRKPFDHDRKPLDRSRKFFDHDSDSHDEKKRSFRGAHTFHERGRKPFSHDRKPFDRDRKSFGEDRKQGRGFRGRTESYPERKRREREESKNRGQQTKD